MTKKLDVLQKDAKIRMPEFRTCPFGLPIADACRNAGRTVNQMTALDEVEDDQKAKYRKANLRVYMMEQQSERCVYADKIVKDKDAVHCDYGEAGAGVRDFPMRPSPFYPRVFHGLGQYGLYSYPVNDYIDNHGARQLFTGIFSMYASEGEVSIKKEGLPLLDEEDELSIKEE